MEILIAVIALLVGLIVAWLVCHLKISRIRSEKEQLASLLAAAEKEVELTQQHAEQQAQESKEHLEEQNREAETRLQELREQMQQRLDEQKELWSKQLKQQLETVQDRMTSTTEKLLKQRTEELEAGNNKAMAGVVDPLKEKLAELHQLVQDTRDKAQENTAGVKEQIRNMMERAQEIGNEANRLTNALMHHSQFQGSMGEQVLGMILDNAGLRKGRDYEEQTTMRSETGETMRNEDTGKVMRPDVILHFPDNRDAIIDSKVSLTDYEQYVNAENDAERESALKRHVDSMRKHVSELSVKNYQKYLPEQHASIDFVIMFVPFEGAFQAAMQKDPTLWTEALQKNVCIAGELNLTVILRMIKMAWTQFDQTQNQEKVYKDAELLIRRVGMLCERFGALRKSIQSVEDRFNDCNDLFDGRQNILAPARRIVALGAKGDKRIPRADNEDEETAEPLPDNTDSDKDEKKKE